MLTQQCWPFGQRALGSGLAGLEAGAVEFARGVRLLMQVDFAVRVVQRVLVEVLLVVLERELGRHRHEIEAYWLICVRAY